MTLSPAFHEVRFPVDISLGSSGGPERSTEIVTLGSGHEQRNQRWSLSRRKFDAGYGVKGLDALHDVIAFSKPDVVRSLVFGFATPWTGNPAIRLKHPMCRISRSGSVPGMNSNFSLSSRMARVKTGTHGRFPSPSQIPSGLQSMARNRFCNLNLLSIQQADQSVL